MKNGGVGRNRTFNHLTDNYNEIEKPNEYGYNLIKYPDSKFQP